MMIWVSEIHVQPRSHNQTRTTCCIYTMGVHEPGLGAFWGLVRVPAQLSSAFTLVIVTTVAFLVITPGAVAELACLACAYDPLAIAAAVRINLQRCFLVRFVTS